MEKNFFDTLNRAVEYILSRIDNCTPIRLQKTLYFTWAIYGGTYGSMKEDDSEIGKEYPKNLFPAEFEAWRYGPVINEVYAKYKNDEYTSDGNISEDLTAADRDIFNYINSIIDELNEIPDFQLVQRSHMDSAWSDVYKEGESHQKMSNEAIREEYAKYANS